MTPTPKSASGGTARQGAVEQGKPQAAAGPFVLNLTSSTTPMALSNPEQPELKRFSFFVSRRFEEGRERFRLHMGYFSTLEEAEEWLGAVRDIYPGAWAGEAPGKKLRERAVAAAAAQAQHAAGPPPPVVPTARQASSAPPRNVPRLPVAQPAQIDVPVLNVPTIHAATPSPVRAAAPIPTNVPVARPAPVSGKPAASNSAPAARPAAAAARPQSAAPAQAPSVIGMMRAPAAKAAPVVPAAAPRSVAPAQARSGAPLTAAPPAPSAAARPPMAAVARAEAPSAAGTAPVAPSARSAQPATQAANGNQQKPAAQTAARAHTSPAPARPSSKANARSGGLPSNVREVLKALDERTNEAEITGETRMMPAPSIPASDLPSDDNNFTDTQVLKFLETRRADGTELTGFDVETGAISLLKPDDTGTRRALKEAVSENAPVWFAVQLQWSVQPVELSKVPPLAIFSAYTLYTVEGSRDGRKWFGLRLGFFSDAISAKQVAYYVRSEFTSVAVVPVSPQERTRASDVEKKADLAFPKKTRSGPVDEFKLIDSDDQQVPTPARARQADGKAAAPAKTAPPSARRPQPKAGSGRVRARETRTPQTLEETLEILGAGELEMDNGTGETMNESGVRHLRVEVQKNTPFGRLLERLSERVRKP
jgi:hypothetical protein